MLIELAQELMAAQRRRRAEAHSRLWRPSMTPATDLGYACERRVVYHRVYPEQAAPINDELASIFEEGDLHQKDVRRELGELGYEVVESEVNFRDEHLEITGTIDGKIQPSREHRLRVPVEIKGITGSAPVDAAAWRDSDSAMMRRWYSQLQTYLHLTEEPAGLGIFKSKMTGLWTIVAAPIDPPHVEQLLQRAERIRDAVRAVKDGGDEFLPARIPDRSECQGCPWRDTICHPEQAPVDPLLLANDIVLKAQVARREQLDAARREFDKLDKALKERFKMTAGDRFLVGGADGFLVTKKQQANGTRITFSNLKGQDHDSTGDANIH